MQYSALTKRGVQTAQRRSGSRHTRSHKAPVPPVVSCLFPLLPTPFICFWSLTWLNPTADGGAHWLSQILGTLRVSRRALHAAVTAMSSPAHAESSGFPEAVASTDSSGSRLSVS
ncbi:hypothetical protein AAFF_G00178180 [Aldrovandia affinis]|uniref:Uncharacterized protein n=1 Tax=Aldrovandia affinis TaxID=143900 RepID=A0AAD7RKW2_9TELE|nr:hypothetical protein AAFF_G00178180 [Aldrovandia affinis]